MAFLNLETFWRGSSLKLLLSVTKDSKNNKELATRNIDVDDLALVCAKLTAVDSEGLQLNLSVKKKEAAKSFTVLINIISKGFAEQLVCFQEWVVVPIKILKPIKDFFYTDNTKVNFYTVEVNITACTGMPAASVVSNQLYEDTEFTDFQLDATDGTVAVHKTVLFIHGDMFRTMVRGDWKETKESRMNIEGASVQTLQHLKEYMYLGTLPDEGLESLLIIAIRYLMEKLEADCINKLIKTLTPEKFDGLIQCACQNNIPQLVRALVLRIPDNIVNGLHKLKINEEKSKDEK